MVELLALMGWHMIYPIVVVVVVVDGGSQRVVIVRSEQCALVDASRHFSKSSDYISIVIVAVECLVAQSM